jgi:hypothetical protein
MSPTFIVRLSVGVPPEAVVSKSIKPAEPLNEKMNAKIKNDILTIFIEVDDFMAMHLNCFYFKINIYFHIYIKI